MTMRSSLLFLIIFLFVSPLLAQEKRTLFDLPRELKTSFGQKNRFKIIPVPVFETDPAAGQRYGIMPTLLWLDKEENLLGIAVAALTYNPTVVKWGGFGGVFLYPSDKEYFELFVEGAQNFIHDYYLQYVNEGWAEDKIRTDIELEYIVDPFERFYGFGPDTVEAQETNFVSALWFWKGKAAYQFVPDIFFQMEEVWKKMTLRTRALNSIGDTATTFAGNAEVASSNQWQHRLSLIWDTRDSNDFPATGHYVEPFFLLSHKIFSGDTFYYGYGLVVKKLFTVNDRFTTVLAFKADRVFGGQIPFYMQPKLGGEFNLRGFVLRRFTGRGRFLFDVEERILVKHWHFMDVDFDLSLDPFFSVGQVFNRWGDIAFTNLQPVGGIGIRAKVLPSVVGRIDIGVGKEGAEVFTGLDYPF